jgi:hypothetical protein
MTPETEFDFFFKGRTLGKHNHGISRVYLVPNRNEFQKVQRKLRVNTMA